MPFVIIIVIAIFAFLIFRAIKKSSDEAERMNNHNKYIEKMNLENESDEKIVVDATVVDENSTDDSSLN